MRYSDPRRLKYSEVKNEDNESGIYKLLDKDRNVIYVGHSKCLRHRLKAVMWKRADYDQVDGKHDLHREAEFYSRAYTDLERARRIERKLKKKLKYNKL